MKTYNNNLIDKINLRNWLDSLPYLERKNMIKKIRAACFHTDRTKIYRLTSLKSKQKISPLEKIKIVELAGRKLFE